MDGSSIICKFDLAVPDFISGEDLAWVSSWHRKWMLSSSATMFTNKLYQYHLKHIRMIWTEARFHWWLVEDLHWVIMSLYHRHRWFVDVWNQYVYLQYYENKSQQTKINVGKSITVITYYSSRSANLATPTLSRNLFAEETESVWKVIMP